MEQNRRYAIAKKVTLIGAVTNALLGLVKIVCGMLFHSHALAADGVHSLADLLADAMVLVASKYGSQDADDTHPYGHQRIETATTLFLSLILILAGVGIAWDAINELIQQQHDIPKILALPIAVLSIIINEILFHYIRRVGNQIQSALIVTNAWHRRSDSGSSLVVLIGLIGTLLGYAGFDAFAAIIVSVLISKMGWEYGWNSVKELVDTAVDPKLLQDIETIISQTDGVLKIHQLRSRSMGGDIFIDVHIQVSPFISVSEGHFIAQHVHQSLMNAIKTIKDVTVHVDPEDDETSKPSLHLPKRKTLELELLHRWQANYPEIQHWVFNYLDGQLTIDIFCQGSVHPDLYQHLELALKQYPMITTIRLFTQLI